MLTFIGLCCVKHKSLNLKPSKWRPDHLGILKLKPIPTIFVGPPNPKSSNIIKTYQNSMFHSWMFQQNYHPTRMFHCFIVRHFKYVTSTPFWGSVLWSHRWHRVWIEPPRVLEVESQRCLTTKQHISPRKMKTKHRRNIFLTCFPNQKHVQQAFLKNFYAKITPSGVFGKKKRPADSFCDRPTTFSRRGTERGTLPIPRKVWDERLAPCWKVGRNFLPPKNWNVPDPVGKVEPCIWSQQIQKRHVL